MTNLVATTQSKSRLLSNTLNFSGDATLSCPVMLLPSEKKAYRIVDIGANASTEEAAETLEDGQEVVNDVAHSFRLTQTGFDKKSYMTSLRGNDRSQ